MFKLEMWQELNSAPDHAPFNTHDKVQLKLFSELYEKLWPVAKEKNSRQAANALQAFWDLSQLDYWSVSGFWVCQA